MTVNDLSSPSLFKLKPLNGDGVGEEEGGTPQSFHNTNESTASNQESPSKEVNNRNGGGEEDAEEGGTERPPPASYMRLSRISCDPCRKRKLRCSRTMPCSTCIRRGIQDQCYQETHVKDSSTPHNHQQQPRLPHQSIKHSPCSNHSNQSGPSKPRKSIQEPHAKRQKRISSTVMHPDEDSGSANVEFSLLKAQEQLRSISDLVRDSENSVKIALEGSHSKNKRSVRRNSFGIEATGSNGLITWKDVSPYLPPMEDCEELIRLFFDDLGYYFRLTQRSMIEKCWHKLLDGPGLERNKMMILCMIFALADGTVPSKTRLGKMSDRARHECIHLMGNPLTTPYGQPVDNSFECVSALILLAIYYMFRGQHDKIWECMGVAVRKGFNIGLFDERHRAWQGLTHIEKEYRRRLAWYMLSLERWQAFMRQLPSALHPDNVHVALASFEHDSQVIRGEIPTPHITPTFPMTLADGRLDTHVRANDGHVVKFVFIELLAVCHDFLDRFSSMTPSQRYSRAQQIDDLLERTLVEGLSDTGMDLSDLRYLRYLSSQTLETCINEKQLGVTMWVSHLFFLRCMVTRRFLTDENAPSHIRFISLTYAQGIVSAIPTLTRKVKEGNRAVQMTWNANHLLCAATAFAVVILGHDPYAGIDSDPLRTLTGKAKKSSFPQEQVQWLADNIFSTLECLDMLVEKGNGVAMVAKQLLESLVGSQEELRALYRKRLSISSSDDMARNQRHDSIPNYDRLVHKVHSWQQSPGSASSIWSPSTTFVDTPTPGHAHYHQHHYQPNSNLPINYQPSQGNGGQRISSNLLPPMQSYPPLPHATTVNTTTTRQPPQSIPAQQQQITPQIIGRFMNASSLLDAVLMEPLDLDCEGKNTTSDLLASLLQQQQTTV